MPIKCYEQKIIYAMKNEFLIIRIFFSKDRKRIGGDILIFKVLTCLQSNFIKFVSKKMWNITYHSYIDAMKLSYLIIV